MALTMATRSKRRYSGNDRHFWPFTLSSHSSDGWRPLGIMLDSGADHADGYSKGCNLKLHALGYSLIVELPQFLSDFKIKHIAHWDAETVARMGRNFYYEWFPCEYGFTFHGDTLHVHYGPQTFDSSTTKNKVFFLPWINWRYIRQSWYGLEGEHLRTAWGDLNGAEWFAQREWIREFEKSVPTVRFKFADYDVEEIEATTHIEEREWRFGTGFFKWLSLFRRPKIRRDLRIEFSSEVGPEKGSWKGGTMGHGIDMLPGELHEDAFRRYCEQEHTSKYRRFKISYIGKISAA